MDFTITLSTEDLRDFYAVKAFEHALALTRANDPKFKPDDKFREQVQTYVDLTFNEVYNIVCGRKQCDSSTADFIKAFVSSRNLRRKQR